MGGKPKLLTPAEVDTLTDPSSAFKATLAWSRAFLACPHAQLGREGAVCPFVPQSLKTNRFWMTLVESDPRDETAMEEIVEYFRSVFPTLEPTTGKESITKTIVIIFPRITADMAPTLIDGIQAKLKPKFVEDGLMLGQFHERNDEPGLHNPEFRPLRSPIPLLAIRHMVAQDVLFLTRSTDSGEKRLKFLSGYLRGLERYQWPAGRKADVSKALRDIAAELEEDVGP